jgi:GntR family transcriptional regulator
MFFQIVADGGLPIYDQIVRQIKFAIAGEALRAGDLVPSVRELARELAINPNTVARAYRELQADGVLASQRGTGLAVLAEAVEPCRLQRRELLRQRVRQVLCEARQSRLDGEELRVLVEEELAAVEQEEIKPWTP